MKEKGLITDEEYQAMGIKRSGFNGLNQLELIKTEPNPLAELTAIYTRHHSTLQELYCYSDT
tara:strand:- start:93 stop:278 length:186 start_codon:yes stop_codon:yes gene_type:complete